MQYPLTLKALEQMESSYEEYGGVPDEVQTIVGSAAQTIKDLPDRTDDEKDVLIASTALMYSADFTVNKALPLNLAEYGDAVKANVEEALAHLTAPKSRDMAQITAAINGGHYTVQHPLALKALKQMESSYEEYGGVPDEVKAIVDGATKAIKELIDRPENEKDVLLATVTLMFSTDFTVYKDIPKDLSAYGDAVKTNVEDALVQLADNGSPKSRDLMQVGMAIAVSMKDKILEMLVEGKAAADEIAEDDPRMLKQLVRKYDQIMARQKAETDKLFSGEQPRLEAKVKEIGDELKTATEDLIRHVRSLTPAAPPPTSKPAIPSHP